MEDVNVVFFLEDFDHRARRRRTADHNAVEHRQFRAGFFEILEQHQPDRRHGRRHRHLLLVEKFVDALAVHIGAGHNELRADSRRGESNAPRIRVKHRHHRQHRIDRFHSQRIAHIGRHRMKHVRAMRIENAFRVSRRSRGVAKTAGRVFVHLRPFELAVLGIDDVLEAERVWQARLRHMRLVGHHHISLHLRQLVGNAFQDRHEGEVEEDDLILGMIDDVDELFGEEARVQRVANGAHPHDAVPGFEVACRVPGHRGDDIAFADAKTAQGLRDLAGPQMYFLVGGARDRPLDGARHDFPVAVKAGGMIDNRRYAQRPVLHQSLHGRRPSYVI